MGGAKFMFAQIQYLGGTYNSSENKTHCTSFVIGGTETKIGDYVLLKRVNSYAKLKDVSK